MPWEKEQNPMTTADHVRFDTVSETYIALRRFESLLDMTVRILKPVF